VRAQVAAADRCPRPPPKPSSSPPSLRRAAAGGCRQVNGAALLLQVSLKCRLVCQSVFDAHFRARPSLGGAGAWRRVAAGGGGRRAGGGGRRAGDSGRRGRRAGGGGRLDDRACLRTGRRGTRNQQAPAAAGSPAFQADRAAGSGRAQRAAGVGVRVLSAFACQQCGLKIGGTTTTHYRQRLRAPRSCATQPPPPWLAAPCWGGLAALHIDTQSRRALGRSLCRTMHGVGRPAWRTASGPLIWPVLGALRRAADAAAAGGSAGPRHSSSQVGPGGRAGGGRQPWRGARPGREAAAAGGRAGAVVSAAEQACCDGSIDSRPP
jgi:hypothetical protein